MSLLRRKPQPAFEWSCIEVHCKARWLGAAVQGKSSEGASLKISLRGWTTLIIKLWRILVICHHFLNWEYPFKGVLLDYRWESNLQNPYWSAHSLHVCVGSRAWYCSLSYLLKETTLQSLHCAGRWGPTGGTPTNQTLIASPQDRPSVLKYLWSDSPEL